MKKICFIALALLCCSCTVRYDCLPEPTSYGYPCYRQREPICQDNGIKEELARIRTDMDYNYQIQNERSIQKEICKFKMLMEEKFNAQNERIFELQRQRAFECQPERVIEFQRERQSQPEIKVIVVPLCQTGSRDLTEIRETVAKTVKESL